MKSTIKKPAMEKAGKSRLELFHVFSKTPFRSLRPPGETSGGNVVSVSGAAWAFGAIRQDGSVVTWGDGVGVAEKEVQVRDVGMGGGWMSCVGYCFFR